MPGSTAERIEVQLIQMDLQQAGYPPAVFDAEALRVSRKPGTTTDAWILLASRHNPTHSRLVRVMVYQFVWIEIYDCGEEGFPLHYHAMFHHPGDGTFLTGVVRACNNLGHTDFSASIQVPRDGYEIEVKAIVDTMLFGLWPKLGFAHFRNDGGWKVEKLGNGLVQRLSPVTAQQMIADCDGQAFFFYLGDRLKKAGQTRAEMERREMEFARDYLFSWMESLGIEPVEEN